MTLKRSGIKEQLHERLIKLGDPWDVPGVVRQIFYINFAVGRPHIHLHATAGVSVYTCLHLRGDCLSGALAARARASVTRAAVTRLVLP